MSEPTSLTSNLLSRLRDRSCSCEPPGYQNCRNCQTEALRAECAAEIERLTRENAALTELYVEGGTALHTRKEDLRAERDRLRALISDAADVLDDDIEGCGNCDYGKGSTGRGSEGEPCEECTDIRALRDRLRSALSGASPSADETAADLWKFNDDGTRDWYGPKWRERISVGTEPKIFVPWELLGAALGFLRRARYFTPEGTRSLTAEMDAFLSTFGDSPAVKASDKCECGTGIYAYKGIECRYCYERKLNER